MGWTFTHKGKNESIKDFFRRELDYRRDDGSYGRVLDCAVVGFQTAYIAYETVDAFGRRKVSAVVCLLRFTRDKYFNFGYKDMSEDMHPYYYDCPERILKLLTPTTDESALKWREKCWERIRAGKARPKLKKGMVVRFEEPVRFKNGWTEREFRVEDPRRLLFSNGSRLFKLSRRTLQTVPFSVEFVAL